MKGRTGSTLSRTKYIKCFRVETSCYRLVLRLKFIVTVELLYDQEESDFVQCQAKMRAFACAICSEFKQTELNWKRIVYQNALWRLVFSTTRQWNRNKSPRRMQVSPPARNDDRSPIWKIWRPLISFLLRRCRLHTDSIFSPRTVSQHIRLFLLTLFHEKDYKRTIGTTG